MATKERAAARRALKKLHEQAEDPEWRRAYYEREQEADREKDRQIWWLIRLEDDERREVFGGDEISYNLLTMVRQLLTLAAKGALDEAHASEWQMLTNGVMIAAAGYPFGTCRPGWSVRDGRLVQELMPVGGGSYKPWRWVKDVVAKLDEAGPDTVLLCEYCGRLAAKTRKKHRYCSDSCRALASQKRAKGDGA